LMYYLLLVLQVLMWSIQRPGKQTNGRGSFECFMMKKELNSNMSTLACHFFTHIILHGGEFGSQIVSWRAISQ
jgi:hypothetical protein